MKKYSRRRKNYNVSMLIFSGGIYFFENAQEVGATVNVASIVINNEMEEFRVLQDRATCHPPTTDGIIAV